MKGLRIIKWVLLGIVFVAVFGLVTMQLWNWLVPALFGGPSLSFWQAIGLLLLAKILLGGFGPRGYRGGGHYWKQRWRNKLSKMTPEEQEEFKKRVRDRWCRPHGAPGTGSNA